MPPTGFRAYPVEARKIGCRGPRSIRSPRSHASRRERLERQYRKCPEARAKAGARAQRRDIVSVPCHLRTSSARSSAMSTRYMEMLDRRACRTFQGRHSHRDSAVWTSSPHHVAHRDIVIDRVQRIVQMFAQLMPQDFGVACGGPEI